MTDESEIMLAVVGSRSFNNYELLAQTIDRLGRPMVIISGGAIGADRLAARYAKEREISLIELLPDWKQYGRRAGLVRNERIVADCDQLVAFWDGQSRGTAHAIRTAKAKGKAPVIVRFENTEKP
jgi:hypothetical protein